MVEYRLENGENAAAPSDMRKYIPVDKCVREKSGVILSFNN